MVLIILFFFDSQKILKLKSEKGIKISSKGSRFVEIKI